MSNIYQRVGEALTSDGKITVVAALNERDELVMNASQFPEVGTLDINGTVVKLYRVTQESKHKFERVIAKQQIYKPEKYVSNSTPHKYKVTFKGHEIDTDFDTSTLPDLMDVAYNPIGKILLPTLMDAAYNPLSILEDYFFPQRKVINITIDKPEDVRKLKDLIHEQQRNKK